MSRILAEPPPIRPSIQPVPDQRATEEATANKAFWIGLLVLIIAVSMVVIRNFTLSSNFAIGVVIVLAFIIAKNFFPAAASQTPDEDLISRNSSVTLSGGQSATATPSLPSNLTDREGFVGILTFHNYCNPLYSLPWNSSFNQGVKINDLSKPVMCSEDNEGRLCIAVAYVSQDGTLGVLTLLQETSAEDSSFIYLPQSDPLAQALQRRSQLVPRAAKEPWSYLNGLLRGQKLSYSSTEIRTSSSETKELTCRLATQEDLTAAKTVFVAYRE